MIKKILVIQSPAYDFSSASLVEGLVSLIQEENYDIELRCTEKSNYACIQGQYDFSLEKEEDMVAFGKKANLIVLCSNQNVKEYLVDLIDPAHKKTIYLDGEDREDHHQNYSEYSVYFKREMLLNKQYPDNVFPFPFAAEKRYFGYIFGLDMKEMNEYAFDKEFDIIWETKNLNLCCLFGKVDDTKKWRKDTENKLLSMNLKNSFVGQNYNKSENIVDTGNRNNRGYYEVLEKSKIGVDDLGSWGCESGRKFETLANACCLLSRRIRVHFPYPFVPTENYFEYKNTDELEYLVNFLIDNPDICKKTARNGFKHLLTYHSTKERARYLLEIVKQHNLIGDNI